MKARLATWNGVTAWDVSTGDPIVPQQVRPPRLHGEDILVLGYRPETTIAEKGVTILETGRHQHPLARLRRHRRWAVPSTGPRQPGMRLRTAAAHAICGQMSAFTPLLS